MFKKIPPQIRFIASAYLCGIIFFTLLRLSLLLINYKYAAAIPLKFIWKSFIIGLGFDTVISGYILIIPLIIYFIFSFLRKDFRILDRIIFVFIVLCYSLSLTIICCDIPWFLHQHTRLTIAALQWTDTPVMMLGIMFGDIKNYPYLILLVLLLGAFGLLDY